MTQQGKEKMKKSESVFFRSGELRMHAARHPGSGDRPIVVVPGITTPAGAFAVAASALADVGSDVYVLDMRGRGLSERVPYGAHRAGDYAERRAGPHRPGSGCISQSWSGTRSVPGSWPPPGPGCPARQPAWWLSIRPCPGPAGVRTRWHSTVSSAACTGRAPGRASSRPGRTTRPGPRRRYGLRGEWLASCDEVAVVESYGWFHLEAFEPVWREVEPPALLLFGADSPVVTAADADLLRRVNPRAGVVAVPGSGHMVPWDNLAQTVAEVGRFLSEAGGQRMKAIEDQDDTESTSVRTATDAAPSLPGSHRDRAAGHRVDRARTARPGIWSGPGTGWSTSIRALPWRHAWLCVTHDIERMFPNGPRLDKATGRWDDPHYLYAHAARSAEVVGFWLHAQHDVPEKYALPEVQRLITLHEFGGVGGADLVQAADSLSFLETLQDIVRKWVTHGECDAGQARAKHRYMAERIRVPAAQPIAERLLQQALGDTRRPVAAA